MMNTKIAGSDTCAAAVIGRPTRRQVISGAALVLGGFTWGSTLAWADAGDGILRTAEAIHQEPVFQANRRRIYKALTDQQQFNKVTEISAAKEPSIDLRKTPTQLSREAGGAFKLFGGIIVGRHIELVPDQRIVQAWRVAFWDPGAYSIAKFELVEQGAGTKIIFDHTGFPKGTAEHLAAGWKAHYWEPLQQFLGSA